MKGPSEKTHGAGGSVPRLRIVVPCFNEAKRLAGNASDYVRFAEQHGRVHVCFVDDGSMDETAVRFQALAQSVPERFTVLRLAVNKGKAEAVRTGMLAVLSEAAPMDLVGYWDADLATPLEELLRFAAVLAEEPAVHFVSGCRVRRMGADIERSWYRHYFGRVFATAASVVLDLPVHDTQCGAKLMRVALAHTIFQEPFISRWMFDVELFARILAVYGREEAGNMLFEFPLSSWRDMGDSKVRPSHLPRIPFDLARIYCAYRRRIGRR